MRIAQSLICCLALPGTLALPGQAAAHSYEVCYEAQALDCQASMQPDPLGNCQAQAMAYCSNHLHGGGGGGSIQRLDLDFTIEDNDDDVLVMTGKLDISRLSPAQKAYLRALAKRNVATIHRDSAERAARYQMIGASATGSETH